MAGRLPQVDRHAVVALAVVEIVCTFLLIFGNRIPSQSLTGSTAAVLAPANSILRWIESVAAGRSDASRLSRELAALRIEHDRIVDAGIENARLKKLLGFSERGRPSLKAFQVTGVAGEPWPVVFHLSGGSDDGIALGQAVLAPEGLVGRIMRVDPRTSSVALLTDPNAPIACEVVGTGVRGVLKFRFGTQPGLYLTAVPLTDTVRVGERIATAVTSTVFPPGIPVGRVAKVGRIEGSGDSWPVREDGCRSRCPDSSSYRRQTAGNRSDNHAIRSDTGRYRDSGGTDECGAQLSSSHRHEQSSACGWKTSAFCREDVGGCRQSGCSTSRRACGATSRAKQPVVRRRS